MPLSSRRRIIMTRVARKFWDYIKDSDQLVATRTELRNLYNNCFLPVLTDYLEKTVPFCDVFWMFRVSLKVVENKPVHDREYIVYLSGREESRSHEAQREDVDGFVELKKKLVDRRHRLNLTKDKGGVSVEPESNSDGIISMNVSSKILKLTVINHMAADLILQCAILGSLGPFEVQHSHIQEIISESMSARLGGMRQTVFDVKLTPSPNPGIYSLPIAFRFSRDYDEPFHIVKYIKAVIVDDVVMRLQPTRPYRRRRRVALPNDHNVLIERGEPPTTKKPRYIIPLASYYIPSTIERHQMHTDRLQELFRTFEGEENYTPERYSDKFSKLLHVEELQMKVDIAKYQMDNAKLQQERPYLTLDVPGLAENRPSLVRGDRLFVRKLAANGAVENENIKYEGYVHTVGLNKVFLKFSAGFHRNFIANSSFQVNFEFSRTTLKVMHRAVQNAAPFLELIPLDGRPSGDIHYLRVPRQTTYFDRKIEENGEQKQAVQNILAGTSKPYPYLVFGPPGTGKTVTIVEAIKQVLKNYPDSKILACAPSNSAADLILERVAQHQVVPKEQMVRLNAFGRHESSVNKNVLEYCIPDGDGFFSLPSKGDIERKYRFVVTTLMTAGRLVSLGIPKSHFTHVFIDEAGQGMEPECLVPITGLLGTDANNLGQLVLAGDPKQLGPVLRSPVAIEHGLRMSLLERLMISNFRCYKRQLLTNQYDPKCVTKLLNNYRSHPDIIKVPNELFYDDELRVCADVAVRNAFCNWEGLKRPGFPVIFEVVCGKDQREEDSPSFFNAEEVSVVLRYVKDLKEARGVPLETSEIGIISPYHRQVQKIRQELRKRPLRIGDIKVGSVEEFQGQERKVIIISTVRSSDEFLQLDAQHKLGFLNNPKRFNVAITRAKALLIVIGNPYVLCHDEHWRRFIKHCVDNRSFSDGSGSSGNLFQMPEDADQSLAEKLEKLCLNESSLFENESDLTGADYEDTPWRSDE